MSSAIDDEKILVGIIMGSDSDWEIMKPAHEVLTDLGVNSKVEVISAHRMPDEMFAYAKSAAEKGLKVIIAGAGGAAHLPGMVASLTTLPVIGVPVPLNQLEGLDSLLSIVQMPAGVPVATVGIGNARNAGLLAARIISVGNDETASKVKEKLKVHQVEMNGAVTERGDKLTKLIKNLASQGN
jgi:5-(carboxyamino)imidazole ribonucleotide mutase